MRNRVLCCMASLMLALNLMSSVVIAEELDEQVIEETIEEETGESSEEETVEEEISEAEEIQKEVEEIVEEIIEEVIEDSEAESTEEEFEEEPEIEEEEIKEEITLIHKELRKEIKGYSIEAVGNMPEDTVLEVSVVGNTSAENKVSDFLGDNKDFSAEITFDIKLMFDGEEYQPTDFDEDVTIFISGIESTEDLDVFRITDDGNVTDMNAQNVSDGVEFVTNHFTEYTVGSTSTNSATDNVMHVELAEPGRRDVYTYRLIDDGNGGKTKEYYQMVCLYTRGSADDELNYIDGATYTDKFYWVKSAEIVDYEILDESDEKNTKGTSILYTVAMTCDDGSVIKFKSFSPVKMQDLGPDKVWDTEDDYEYYTNENVGYQVPYWIEGRGSLSTPVYKGESGKSYSFIKSELEEIYQQSYYATININFYLIPQYDLTLVDKAGNTILKKTNIDFQDDITAILSSYVEEGFEFEDVDGKTYTTMPVGDLTLKLVETDHVAGETVKENVVAPSYTKEGSFDEVVYCKHCHQEMSRTHKTTPKLTQLIVEPVVDDTVTPSSEENEESKEDKPANTEPSVSDETNPVVNPIIEPVVEIEELVEVEETEEQEESFVETIMSEYGPLEIREVDIVALTDDEIGAVEEVKAEMPRENIVAEELTEETEEETTIAKIVKVFVYTVTTGAAGGGLFFVFWYRRRKVKGKILSRDGLNYSNCLITLEGRDKLRTYSNKKGEFTFRNLKKDSYILTVFDEQNRTLLVAELFTNEKEPNLNVIENNVGGCQFDAIGKTYLIEVLA